jgi:translation initiation factor 1
VLHGTDPFAEANAGDSGAAAGSKDYVHVRIQQRNGRKSLTTVQGLKKEFSYSKILKDLKKEFCCNGTVVQDPELGQVRCSFLFLVSFWAKLGVLGSCLCVCLTSYAYKLLSSYPNECFAGLGHSTPG